MEVTLIIAAATVLVILLSVYIHKESTGFKVTGYEYRTDKLKCDEFKIVLIADLHDTDHGRGNDVIIEKIDEIGPDIVCFAGDMITSCMEMRYDCSMTLSFIEKLALRYPVYYGMGNHEEIFKSHPDRFPGMYEELTERLNAANAHLLDDEVRIIPEAGLIIYGLGMEHEYYRRLVKRELPDDYLKDKFGPVREDLVSILLAHNPEYFEAYAAWHPDFVFSGHVHGGIINVPFLGGLISPSLKLFPKYDAGEFKKDKSVMILSRGLGYHTVRIRIRNKAEIVSIRLIRDKRAK